eukprot:TRINITY_DN15388_c0_g1_i1.p1 TRINITY_DN15388_c0_g1~~TRINITY_DN15388_c0_g1_i1.p1  ORF type:complete len:108 (-),score=24.87 TRINITY_DN15388_c0_g1_i1:46-369(-)
MSRSQTFTLGDHWDESESRKIQSKKYDNLYSKVSEEQANRLNSIAHFANDSDLIDVSREAMHDAMTGEKPSERVQRALEAVSSENGEIDVKDRSKEAACALAAVKRK